MMNEVRGFNEKKKERQPMQFSIEEEEPKLTIFVADDFLEEAKTFGASYFKQAALSNDYSLSEDDPRSVIHSHGKHQVTGHLIKFKYKDFAVFAAVNVKLDVSLSLVGLNDGRPALSLVLMD